MKKSLKEVGYNKCKICSMNFYGGCETSYEWSKECIKNIAIGLKNKIITGKYVKGLTRIGG